ncbi:MAG TPA: PilZ domain-containing protein [Gammaproteobacteria bacterium]|nr:PilZ domain-containing protein [Gammaproteobacteria bacterium]
MFQPLVLTDTNSAERRAYPRIGASCNALLRLSDTLTFRCLVRNLSREAAQVVCDARYALLVQPAGTMGRRARHRGLEISIALPLAGSVSAFTAACVAKYCAPFEGDHMVLGLKFVDLDRASRAQLGEFLAGTLR